MKKALFLDRDGVINIEKDYLYKIEDFIFIDGIFDLCKYFIKQGYLIFIVTNQSGIARKYYSENDFEILTTWMLKEFSQHDIVITEVYHCPHHPDISGSCECRKPKPDMLYKAQREFNIDLSSSVIIGDKERDIQAGHNAGLKKSYLFDSTKKIKNSAASKIVSSLYEIMEE
jgi:D-glycero-D-manno-heptose 1,7-bisphosphate phosphatase